MNLGKAIRNLRKEAGYKQGDFAEICNISQNALCQIEHGNTYPHKETLDKMAAALKIPIPMIHLLSIERSDIDQSKLSEFDSFYYPSLVNIIKTLFKSNTNEK